MNDLTHVSVETLFRDMAEQLDLKWVAGRNGGQRERFPPKPSRNRRWRSLATSTSFTPIGCRCWAVPKWTTCAACRHADLQDAINHLFSTELAAIIVSNGEPVPAMLRDSAERTETPLLTSPLAEPGVDVLSGALPDATPG